MNRRQMKQKAKKQKRRKRVFWFLLFPILLIASSTIAYGTWLVKKAEHTANKSYEAIEGRKKSELRKEIVNPNDDNISILFLGIDTSDHRDYGETARTDALMLATLNQKEKSVKLLSIPRDTYVYIDEVGYKTKINHAHAYGGPEASIHAVEKLLDIPVDYYVRMDFNAFMDVVEALDGIEVDVPYAFTEQDSKDNQNAISLKAGLQTLNGEEALAFARTRKKDSDVERGKRQQEVMKAVLDKAVSLQSVVKYGKIIDAIGSNMKTNMAFDEMKALIDYGVSGKLNVETLVLEGEDSYIKNVYYYQVNDQSLEELKTKLKKHLHVSNKEDRHNDKLNQEEEKIIGIKDDSSAS